VEASATTGGVHVVKATVIGGVLFLVPVVVPAMILPRAIEVMRAEAEPVAHTLPPDSIAGVALADVVAVLVAFDEGTRIGLEIERLEDDRVAVMTPSSPNP